MRKLSFLLALGALLIVAACSNDDDLYVASSSDTSSVTFTLSVPSGVQTRQAASWEGYSDGSKATDLYVEVYQITTSTDDDGNETSTLAYKEGLCLEPTGVDWDDDLSQTVTLQLVNGNTYGIVFWAQAPDDDCGEIYDRNFDLSDDADGPSITIDTESLTSNTEAYDAFYKYETITVTADVFYSIELTRPLAQLNWGTNDYAAAVTAGVDTASIKAELTLGAGIGTQLNLADGSVETSDEEIVFAASHPEVAGEDFPVDGYEYLNMNYVLFAEDKGTVDATLAVTADGMDGNTIEVSQVPLQRNYRTNIYGSLLTSNVEYTVEINPYYEEDDYDIYYPIYEVGTQEELVEALSTTGGTIILTDDITITSGSSAKTRSSDDSTDDYATLTIENDAKLVLDGYTLTAANIVYTTDNMAIVNSKDDEENETKGSVVLTTTSKAIESTGGASLTLSDLTLDASSATTAIYLGSEASGLTTTVNNCSIAATNYGVYIAGDNVTFKATGSTITTTGTNSRGIASSAANTTIRLTDVEISSPYLGVYASGDGTIISATDTEVEAIWCYYATNDNTSVTLDGGSCSGTYYGVLTLGDDVTIAATDVEVEAGYGAYYATGDDADITISGGSIETVYDAVCMIGSDGTLAIDDATITTSGSGAWGLYIGSANSTSKTTTSGNTATVTNTTIDVSESGMEGVGMVVYGYDNDIVLENCSIMHDYFGITQQGSYTPGSEITVKDSYISGPYTGIYLSMAQNCDYYNTLNVSGSTIISEESTPIEVKKTYLTVSESALTSQYAGEDDDSKQQDYFMYGSGSAGAGYGIVLAGYKTGQAYSYDFTDLSSVVTLSDITYTLSVQYAMDGESDPWYVLQYMGYEEDSTSSDYSAQYTSDGATSSSSYASSSGSTESSARRSYLPWTERELKAKAPMKVQ